MTEVQQGLEIPNEPHEPVNQPEYGDYWGSDETTRWYLPDGKQYFDLKVFNEGDKAKYQRITNKDVILESKTQNARMSVNPVEQRHTLIKLSVTGWMLMQKDAKGEFSPAPFDAKKSVDAWLEVAPPKIVEDLELAIRKLNPFLMDEEDMPLEEIEREINRLQELREAKEKQEMGEGSSTSR